MPIKRRLYRSQNDRIFAGLFGGLGEYFEIDPVILRLVWIVLFIITGIIPGVIIYLIAIFIVPPEPIQFEPASSSQKPKEEPATESKLASEQSIQAPPSTSDQSSERPNNAW